MAKKADMLPFLVTLLGVGVVVVVVVVVDEDAVDDVDDGDVSSSELLLLLLPVDNCDDLKKEDLDDDDGDGEDVGDRCGTDGPPPKKLSLFMASSALLVDDWKK